MAKQKGLVVNFPDPTLLAWVQEQAAIEERTFSGMVRILIKMARRELERGAPLLEEPAPQGEAAA